MQSNRNGVPQSHRATVEQPDRALPARGKWTRPAIPPMPEPDPFSATRVIPAAGKWTRPAVLSVPPADLLEWNRAGDRANSRARQARKRAAEVAGPVSTATYAAILSSGPCVYCGDLAEQVDHVRPLARGGREHPANLVPSCARCNRSKRARLLTEWQAGRVTYGVAHSSKVAAEAARLANVDGHQL